MHQDSRPPEDPSAGADSVIHAPGSAWSQFDLGSDIDANALSVIAELDPTGVHGVVEDVLKMFEASIEPLLSRLEQVRADRAELRFEAHKLYSAAAQVGAMRVARGCQAISQQLRNHPHGGDAVGDAVGDPSLEALYADLVVEIIRLQRKLRQLLGG